MKQKPRWTLEMLIAALAVLAFLVYMLVRPNKYNDNHLERSVKVSA